MRKGKREDEVKQDIIGISGIQALQLKPLVVDEKLMQGQLQFGSGYIKTPYGEQKETERMFKAE